MNERTKLVINDLTLMLSALVICTVLGKLVHPLVTVHRINISMIYVLAVVIVAAYRRTKIGFVMPVLAIAAFILTFGLREPLENLGTDHIIAITIMVVIASLISGMANRIRRQGEEATRAEMVIEKEKLRNILLSSVSHDLRTPLTAIAGAASSLMVPEQLDDDMRQDLAASIYRESQRLNRLLRNLLDITRVESGTTTLRREWHSIEEIVGAALSLLDRELAAHTITTNIPDNLPLVILDDTLIEQVLVNLLDNAAKYVPEGQAVHIWAQVEAGHILVGVDSVGVALSQKDLDKLFEKFYRGENVGTTHGTGLGLTICKAIVELHGGRITAQQLPQALSFRFTLPITADAPEVLAEEAEIAHG